MAFASSGGQVTADDSTIQESGGVISLKDGGITREKLACAVLLAKTEVATWTGNWVTTSSTYADITNATVTVSGLDASKNYDLICIAMVGRYQHGVSGQNAGLKLLIDSTEAANAYSYRDAGSQMYATDTLCGKKESATGSTSYTAKLQGNSSDNANGATFNLGDKTCSLILMAIEVA